MNLVLQVLAYVLTKNSLRSKPENRDNLIFNIVQGGFAKFKLGQELPRKNHFARTMTTFEGDQIA